MKHLINDDEAGQWSEFWADCSRLLTIYPERPATMNGDAEAKQLERRLKNLGAVLLPALCDSEHWLVEASVGKGNWAAVPWVAFFDSRETTSAQKGVYPVIHFSTESPVGIRIGLGVAATAYRGREDARAGEVWEQLGSESRQELTEAGFVDVVDGASERTAIGSGGLARRYDKGMVFERFVEIDEIQRSPNELTQSVKSLLTTYMQWVDEHGATPKPPGFVDLMRVLANERVVLMSPKQGSRYCITDVDDGGCSVQRLDSESPARVTASGFESRLAWLRQKGGEVHRKDIDNTVATQICYLQMPELGLKADRQMVVAFEDNSQRADNFISLIRSMQTFKLYKPVILALVIEAIRDEELLDNHIHFDWLLPRFIKRMREHGEEIGEQQLAEGFGRLASDLFWMLAHRDTNELLDVSSPTAGRIRERVSHARLQEAYWRMLQDDTCRQRVLNEIENKWWPTIDKVKNMPNYWLLSPGEGGILWDHWLEDGVATIGWHHVGDLSQFEDEDSVADRVSITYPDYGKKAVARMLWHFYKRLKTGDVVFAKRGRTGVYGWGIVSGEYAYSETGDRYQENDDRHPHVRSVEWRGTTQADMPAGIWLAMQTLTPMNENRRFLCEMKKAYVDVPGFEEVDCDTNEPKIIDVIDVKPETNIGQATGNLIDAIAAKGFIFHPWQIATYITAMRTKPFVILAGVSGTGKSKLPALVAELTTGKIERISVRPDWTDSSDVLGYVDLQDKFRPGVVLNAARLASSEADRFHVCLLDEMNLARVEHYFAEVLSAIEDRLKAGNGGFESTKLITQTLPATYREWQEQTMPANFGIVGTVNMDESSHGFSRKVLDRAFTLELSEVDLDLDQSSPANASVEPVYWPPSFWHCRATRISECDQEDPAFREAAERATTVLQAANKSLVHSQLQVGYRTRDEVILFLLNAGELSDSFTTRHGERVDPLDLALMMKVLPRLVGGSNAIRRTMIGLLGLAHGQSMSDSDDAETVTETWVKAGRPDAIEGANYPRTASRLCLMWERLTSEGYTSFWL